ncbi:RNA polymerase sigma factor [uncultured Amnibacterium sp.]|uniref:RNA polymerase sigma factor n=1 Tax=uncultured Amnibacterium sp. TaxID=1631851 RepID=UPI0035CB03FD
MDVVTSEEAGAWERALDGDGRAFASLFALHRERVLRAARRLVVSPTDAEDVAAAGFFELWRKREHIVLVDGSVLPWLLVAAQNLSRNANRSVRRYRSVLDSLPHSRSANDPADTMQERRALSELGAAFRQLKPVDAALVSLAGIEGMSVSAAALVLGLSPGNARTRLYRSRQRMRAVLDGAVPVLPAAALRTEGADE